MLCSIAAYATHNRAGEITMKRVGYPVCQGANSYEITITTYTKESSNADRCNQMLYVMVSGQVIPVDSIEFPRINGPTGTCPNNIKMGVSLGNDIKKNIYYGVYTFNGPGTWVVGIVDPNRNAGVKNMDNSVETPFSVTSMVVISPFLGCNSSPELLYPPIDNACYCKRFVHNPNAYDPDGDSLAYELVSCQSGIGIMCAGFLIPPGNVTLNVLTGDFVWDCPGQMQGNLYGAGEYNFAIKIKEYRQGVLIGFVVRDLQVTVSGNCPNDPPVIVDLPDTCVTAGDFVSFIVSATDPNVGNIVTLTSTGGPYLVPSSPAQFTQGVQAPTTVIGQFTWQTNCSHIATQPYTVSFRAVDNHITIPLTDIKTRRITVVSPGPTNLTATPAGSTIILNWTPTVCTDATGYKIYRKKGCSTWQHGICETGIPAYTGYVLIATVNGSGTTTYTDNNNGTGLIHGEDYSYMIYAYFGDNTKSSFNSKSYASNEACAKLKKDVPIITHVSVENTDVTTGIDTVRWLQPTEYDTVFFKGPFKYLIYRASGINGGAFTLVDSTGMVNGIKDTTYIHTNLNTQDFGNTYKIDFYQDIPNRQFISSSHTASSVFLNLTPSDNTLTLNWSYNVPWTNDTFFIFKRDNATLLYNPIPIGSTTTTSFIETGLVNGVTYCYKIMSSGHYSDTTILHPLLNWSQEACGVPQDLTPPCAPTLAVSPDCDNILNSLSWNNPNLTCADDVTQYKIYWRPQETGDMKYIGVIDGSGNITTTHNDNGKSIAGCYYITALDSFANESEPSNVVCVDNCPLYRLPNIYTPNNDGSNDLFHALIPYRYIESIDIKIFNRWGEMVFTTTDPDVNWNGLNMTSKRPCTTGVYYYTCTVNEIRLVGIVPHELHGFLHLMSNGEKPNGN